MHASSSSALEGGRSLELCALQRATTVQSVLSVGTCGTTVRNAGSPLMSPSVVDMEPPKTPSVLSRVSKSSRRSSPRIKTSSMSPRKDSGPNSPGGRRSVSSNRITTQNPLARDPTTKLHWRKGKYLGAGAFGKVWLGLNQTTGQLMAVKAIEFTSKDKDVANKLQGLQQEIKMMKGLHHPNIVTYYCTERVNTTINIFMEFVPGGSISALISEFGALSEPTVKNYTIQILRALEYLHDNGVVHRDVKAANVLVNVHGVCKLSDFGTAARLEDLRGQTSGNITGTPAWMAPEVILPGHTVGKASDVWSLAATILEMLTAKPPFAHLGFSTCELLEFLGNATPVSLPVSIDDAFRPFLLLCFEKCPEKRPTCMRLLDTMTDAFRDDSMSTIDGSDSQYYEADNISAGDMSPAGDTSFTSSPHRRSVNNMNEPTPPTPGTVFSHFTGGGHGIISIPGEEPLDLTSIAGTEYMESFDGNADCQLSPTTSRKGRSMLRRKPTIDTNERSVTSASKRSHLACDTPASRGRLLIGLSPLANDESAKIGRHLIGSCLTLMSIIPEIDAQSIGKGSCAVSVCETDLQSERDIIGALKSSVLFDDDQIVSRIDSLSGITTHDSTSEEDFQITPIGRSVSPNGDDAEESDNEEEPSGGEGRRLCPWFRSGNWWSHLKTLCIVFLALIVLALVLVLTLK